MGGGDSWHGICNACAGVGMGVCAVCGLYNKVRVRVGKDD